MSDDSPAVVPFPPPPQAQPRGLPNVLRLMLGVIAVTAGCLASQGNGESPLLYFLFGFVVTPLLMVFVGRFFQRPRLAELLLAVACGAASFAFAYATSRRDPNVVFRAIFDSDPPASVRNLTARKQWFDGRIWLASFDISDGDFSDLVRHAALKPAEHNGAKEMSSEMSSKWAESVWSWTIGQWGALAYGFWPYEKRLDVVEVYKRTDSTFGDPKAVQLLRHPPSGHVWAVRLD